MSSLTDIVEGLDNKSIERFLLDKRHLKTLEAEITRIRRWGLGLTSLYDLDALKRHDEISSTEMDENEFQQEYKRVLSSFKRMLGFDDYYDPGLVYVTPNIKNRVFLRGPLFRQLGAFALLSSALIPITISFASNTGVMPEIGYYLSQVALAGIGVKISSNILMAGKLFITNNSYAHGFGAYIFPLPQIKTSEIAHEVAHRFLKHLCTPKAYAFHKYQFMSEGYASGAAMKIAEEYSRKENNPFYQIFDYCNADLMLSFAYEWMCKNLGEERSITLEESPFNTEVFPFTTINRKTKPYALGLAFFKLLESYHGPNVYADVLNEPSLLPLRRRRLDCMVFDALTPVTAAFNVVDKNTGGVL